MRLVTLAPGYIIIRLYMKYGASTGMEGLALGLEREVLEGDNCSPLSFSEEADRQRQRFR